MQPEFTSAEWDELRAASLSCACLSFRKASRAVTSFFDHVLQPTGIRATQLILLLKLAVAGSTTIPLLARRLVMDRSTVSRNLSRLVVAGLVTERKGEKQGQEYGLSNRGAETIRAAVPLWRKSQGHLVNELGQQRWERLFEDLQDASRIATLSTLE